MLQAETGLIFWTFISFFILLFVLYRWGLPPLLKILKKRDELIEAALKSSEESKKKAAELVAAALAKIEEEKKRLKNEIGLEKQNLALERQKILEEARLEAKHIIEEAEKSLERNRAEVIKEIKKDMAELIVETAKKFLRRRLSAREQEELLEEGLTELEKAYGEKNI